MRSRATICPLSGFRVTSLRRPSGEVQAALDVDGRARELRHYIERFPQASVLVLGDLILDHYVWGRVTRISPEAPVPVVHVESEEYKLGGAANVFNNIHALGGQADICGVVGKKICTLGFDILPQQLPSMLCFRPVSSQYLIKSDQLG